MKSVELFTINRNTKVVPASDYLNLDAWICSQSHITTGIGPVDGIYQEQDNAMRRVTIPVFKICNFTDSRSNFKKPVADEQYIAIEPELLELLTIKERQKIEELKGVIHDLNYYKHKSEKELDDWWSAPWYVRVWRAAKANKKARI